MAQIETVNFLQLTNMWAQDDLEILQKPKTSKNYCKTSWNEPLCLASDLARREFPRWIIVMKRLHILRRMTKDVYMQCFKNYLPGLVLFVSMRSWLMYLCAIFSRMLFLFFNFFEREIGLLWCSVYDITERTPKNGL